MTQDASNEVIHVWADGTWCYPDELSGMNHMSDDYQTVDADEFMAKIEEEEAWRLQTPQ